MEEEKKEIKDEKGDGTKGILAGIGASLGIVALGIGGKIIYDKYKKKETPNESEEFSNFKSVNNMEIIEKLKKQKALKPKIINDEYDRNYIRADSIQTKDEEELIKSRTTILDYMDALDRLHLIENQEAFSLNYRSSNRVGKVAKRHFTDPSLACACLDLSIQKLLLDHDTFGLLFEALVERDLRVYMDYLDGKLYHFRDNASGDEVDGILEFANGDYAAVEIKLTSKGIDDGKTSLQTFYKNVKKKPKFMCIIVGHYEAVIQDPETGIYILPITALKP